MIELIPSYPSEKSVPRKLIQETEKRVAGRKKTSDTVRKRLSNADIRATIFTAAAFLTPNNMKPVIKGIKSMTSNIMVSDYQDKNDK
jgi:hypothetical protein